ncbi:RNA methyltransferase [Robbsia sp. KACC 23696]|uniref:RNA methyltransferase n=1 Tax=Robbsia sp. KACC 23696 TaxID=3149231 RepID=UPI00325A5C7B
MSLDLTAMPIVQSRSNALFKRLRTLAGAAQKQRREGVAILEGVHLADAYLQALTADRAALAAASDGRTTGQRDAMPLERVVVSQSAAARDDVRAILVRIHALWLDRTTVFDDGLFEQVSPVSDGGIGILLLIAAPQITLASLCLPASSSTSIAAARAGDGGRDDVPGDADEGHARIVQNCVILDGVQDAGNVGSILRSAAAAGVTLAFCLPGTATVWSTKVLRAAMGAHFVMRIVEQAPSDAVAAVLGVPVVITDSHASESIYEADLCRPLAWVMGNEGAGVSAFWRERAAVRLTIPQPGRIESLNVAAAAAVCLFEQTRQLSTPRVRS